MENLLMLFELREKVEGMVKDTAVKDSGHGDESMIGQSAYLHQRNEYNRWSSLLSEIDKQIIKQRDSIKR